MKALWVLGAGGHAKSVIDAARTAGGYHVAGLLDDDIGRSGTEVLGAFVQGIVSQESIARLAIEWAVIAVGSNVDRQRLAERCVGFVRWATLVHARAYLAPGVVLGEGTVVMAGAVVQPDTHVGKHVIINTASSVDHDGRIGDYAHIAPAARLGGAVTIGAGALLGLGCAVLPERVVGDWTVVGAGAVVAHDVPAGARVKGLPARQY